MYESNLVDFVLDNPGPPPIPKGEKRHFSVTVSNAEYEAISKLAHHSDLDHLFNGQLYQVVRYCLYPTLFQLAQLSGHPDVVDPIKLVTKKAKVNSLQITRRNVHGMLDELADRLTLLVDNGMWNEALHEEYEEFLRSLNDLPSRWRRLIWDMSCQHAEMNAWRRQVHEHPDMQMSVDLDVKERVFTEDL